MALNRAGGAIGAPFHLAFLTDRRRGVDALAVARALPAGAAVILRDYDDPARAATARLLADIAAARGLILLIGADAELARTVGAAGLHLRSGDLAAGAGERRSLIVSAACHSAEELERAGAIGADIALLSPVFATPSHPDTESLGAEAFRRLAALSALPVLALGGVDGMNARRLAGPNVAGFAAIGAFAARRIASSE
jgi:thiamine monophosphate synthase